MQRILRTLALSTAALTTSACQKAPTPPTFDASARLDAAVEDAMTKRDLPGLALVVVQGDRVVYSKGYGLANIEKHIPVSDTTPFVIGSTSKPLTALAVLRLVAQHKVALDTPIVRYASELKFIDPRASSITLRHLLTNRSGLPVGFSGPAYAVPSIQDRGALERQAHAMTLLPLRFAPGQGYTYSNRGWALAGYIVQRVSGLPIEDFMQREIFTPLGMRHSTLEFWKVPNLPQGYAEGRATRNHPQPPSLTREYGPAGMMVSTVTDIGNLLVAMLNEGRTVAGTQFLPPDLIHEALRPQADAESELGGPTKYGLGWEIDSMMGTLTIKKAGSVHTMVTLWVMLPEKKLGIGLAMNREDYEILPLLPNLIKVLAGVAPTPLKSGGPAPLAPPVASSVRAGGLKQWVGIYDSRVGDTRVYQRGDSLFADMDGSEVALVAKNESTFVLFDDLVSHAGKEVTFRKQGTTITLWQGQDSLGVRMR